MRIDEGGFDTIWLAEAYPWWRKHSMEARSSTALSPLVARETERLAVGWGIISPFTRHPIQIAMEARVTQEAAGPGALLPRPRRLEDLHAACGDRRGREARRGDEGGCGDRPRRARRRGGRRRRQGLLGARAGAARRRRGAALGRAALLRRHGADDAAGRRRRPATGSSPRRSRRRRSSATSASELAEAGRDPDSLDLGCTIVASIDEDRERGRDGAREIAGMYLANKVQNIQAAADTLLECAGLTQDEIRPVAEAMEQGGRLAAKAAVTDEILDKCKPIAGTPGGLHRRDRGVPRGGLHARDARALGRGPAPPDRAVRPRGAPPLPVSVGSTELINERRRRLCRRRERGR